MLEIVDAAPNFAPIRHFILGKIYRDKEYLDLEKAKEHFLDVLRYSTSQDLIFSAKVNLAYIYLQQEDTGYSIHNDELSRTLIAQARDIANQLFVLRPNDDDVKSLMAACINRKAYRSLWRMIDAKIDDPIEFEKIAQDFSSAVRLKPSYVGYAVNEARCFAEISGVYSRKGDLAKACVYANKGFQSVKVYWDGHPKWRNEGTLKQVRDMLVATCPEGILE